MEPVNPEMLTLARETRGLTQAEVAIKAGIVQATVSKYENGTLSVSEEHLGKLSRALGFPASFFRQRDRVYGSMCLHHRKRQTLSVRQLSQIHAKFNVILMQIQRLLRSVEIDSSQTFPAMPLDEYETPEKVARALRAAWRMPAGPVRNLMSIIESSGGIVFTLPLETDKFDAMSLWATKMPPVIFVNERFPGDRLRFNLAHELGHLIMHGDPSLLQEEEADRFASEFLMPAEEIRPQLANLSFDRLATLKPYWKVSMQALIRRAHTLGLISERQQRTFYMKLSSNGWRKKEPIQIPLERPTVVRTIVDVHLRDYAYSVAELCEAICASPDDFQADFTDTQAPNLRIVQ
jgi:Zn-dependent peptidase ImmA (M78 family)/transcriptional regulator with XRE-family HTH domain